MSKKEILELYVSREFRNYSLTDGDMEIISKSYGFARFEAYCNLKELVDNIKKELFKPFNNIFK